MKSNSFTILDQNQNLCGQLWKVNDPQSIFNLGILVYTENTSI